MQRALWFQSGTPVLLINSPLCSPAGAAFGHPPQTPTPGKGTPTPPKTSQRGLGAGWSLEAAVPCVSILPGVGTTSGYHWLGVSHWGLTGCTHTAAWVGGWMGPHAHPHPKHPGCGAGSHCAQVRRARVPGRGRGPRQPGWLRVRLPPAYGPRRGSPPRNYSIHRKITEQGGSLPAPFPATLPEPPPRHRSPNPFGTRPMATAPALQPAHPHSTGPACALVCLSECRDHSTPCQPPRTLQPWAAPGWGTGVAPAPSQDRARAPTLRPCPGRPKLTPHPPQGLQVTPRPHSEGLGSEEPMPGPAAPKAAASPPAQGGLQPPHLA